MSLVADDLGAYRAYTTGDYHTVDGPVNDFQPMPYQGHQEECFSVKDQRFCYSDYGPTPGFHNATSHGGPIREGLPVRIAYRNGQILRLEVPQEQAISQAQADAVTAAGERQTQQQVDADPTLRQLNLAFSFAGMCWAFWWNVQWKLAMRFWVRPPYRPWVQGAFRTFFALSFVGGAVQFIRELIAHPPTRQSLGSTVLIAAATCTLVAVMSAVTLWAAQRRDKKAAPSPTTRS